MTNFAVISKYPHLLNCDYGADEIKRETVRVD